MADQLIEDPVKAKDNAYWERNQLVSALSKMFPSHLAKHPEEDKDWEDDWRTIVVITLPSSATVHSDDEKQMDYQMTWHIHDQDIPMFDHLLYGDYYWDGHTTEEKYRRLRLIRKQS